MGGSTDPEDSQRLGGGSDSEGYKRNQVDTDGVTRDDSLRWMTGIPVATPKGGLRAQVRQAGHEGAEALTTCEACFCARDFPSTADRSHMTT